MRSCGDRRSYTSACLRVMGAEPQFKGDGVGRISGTGGTAVSAAIGICPLAATMSRRQ